MICTIWFAHTEGVGSIEKIMWQISRACCVIVALSFLRRAIWDMFRAFWLQESGVCCSNGIKMTQWDSYSPSNLRLLWITCQDGIRNTIETRHLDLSLTVALVGRTTSGDHDAITGNHVIMSLDDRWQSLRGGLVLHSSSRTESSTLVEIGVNSNSSCAVDLTLPKEESPTPSDMEVHWFQ